MKKIYLETFGCQMNVLDSELVEAQLRALGYSFTPALEDADVVLYNTCSVRERSEQKVWSRLGRMRDRKAADRRRRRQDPALPRGGEEEPHHDGDAVADGAAAALPVRARERRRGRRQPHVHRIDGLPGHAAARRPGNDEEVTSSSG